MTKIYVPGCIKIDKYWSLTYWDVITSDTRVPVGYMATGTRVQNFPALIHWLILLLICTELIHLKLKFFWHAIWWKSQSPIVLTGHVLRRLDQPNMTHHRPLVRGDDYELISSELSGEKWLNIIIYKIKIFRLHGCIYKLITIFIVSSAFFTLYQQNFSHIQIESIHRRKSKCGCQNEIV